MGHFELLLMVETPVCLCPSVWGMQQLVAGLEAGPRTGVVRTASTWSPGGLLGKISSIK